MTKVIKKAKRVRLRVVSDRDKRFALYGFIGIIALGLVAFALLLVGKQAAFFTPQPVAQTVLPKPTEAPARIVYKGQTGKNALVLLQKKASIVQDDSGLVISINTRRADDKKREYWAFYVNNKLATVGPADYQTSDVDTIEWKIEKY